MIALAPGAARLRGCFGGCVNILSSVQWSECTPFSLEGSNIMLLLDSFICHFHRSFGRFYRGAEDLREGVNVSDIAGLQIGLSMLR